jgi:hypothetical protein
MKAIAKTDDGLVVPASIQRRAGIKAGDRLTFKVSSQTITITASAAAYKPTKSEWAAIRKGEAEIARGESASLSGLLHEMDGNSRKVGKKTTRKSSR